MNTEDQRVLCLRSSSIEGCQEVDCAHWHPQFAFRDSTHVIELSAPIQSNDHVRLCFGSDIHGNLHQTTQLVENARKYSCDILLLGIEMLQLQFVQRYKGGDLFPKRRAKSPNNQRCI